MKYQYPLKIDETIINKLREISQKQGRSLNKQIEIILKQYIENNNF